MTDIGSDYDRTIEQIANVYADFAESMVDDDLSDDAGMQVLADAKDICEANGVPQEDRIDVICAGMRRAMVRRIDENIAQVRWQLELMSGL